MSLKYVSLRVSVEELQGTSTAALRFAEGDGKGTPGPPWATLSLGDISRLGGRGVEHYDDDLDQ
jgi:hypothetical protein